MTNGEDLLVVQAREEWQSHLPAGAGKGMLKQKLISEGCPVRIGQVITGIESTTGKTI